MGRGLIPGQIWKMPCHNVLSPIFRIHLVNKVGMFCLITETGFNKFQQEQEHFISLQYCNISVCTRGQTCMNFGGFKTSVKAARNNNPH